jgi:hypothetical protein
MKKKKKKKEKLKSNKQTEKWRRRLDGWKAQNYLQKIIHGL